MVVDCLAIFVLELVFLRIFIYKLFYFFDQVRIATLFYKFVGTQYE
jgi:hypothetical protein